MKIAFLAFTSIPKLGGAQVFAYNLAKNLSNRSHEVNFYLPRKYYHLISRLPIDKKIKVKPIFFNEKFLVNTLPLIIYWSLLFKQMIHNYDVWQVIGVYPAGFVARKLAKRVPVVVRSHGDDIQKDKFLNYGLRLDKTIAKKITCTLNEVTELVALTQTVSKCYKELGVSEKKIVQIPNGIEFDRFRKPIDKNQLRDCLGIIDDESMILSVGRYHKKKGYEVALEAAKILMERKFKFKWIIVGKGVKRLKQPAIDLGVAKAIRLIEKVDYIQNREPEDSFKVPSTNLIGLYRSSDIFVLPSLLETFGMVLIEAMAAGIPVVTTDAPGCCDVVSHEFNGVIAKSGDPVSLSKNIEDLLTKKKLTKKVSSNALIDSEKYDYSIIADKYLNMYSKLCDVK